MRTLRLLVLYLSISVSIANAAITQAEFNSAVTSSGYKTPKTEVYRNFNEGTSSFSREEAAMFLAQILHESAGFVYLEEIACKKTKCPGKYVDNVGLPGKYYYGRGYIQLTWGRNYKAASEALGLGDQLLQNPDLVASDKRLAMLVSVWYWTTNVRPQLKKHPNWFGITTKAINAPECKKYPERSKKRWNIYVKVAAALKLTNKALEKGCYN